MKTANAPAPQKEAKKLLRLAYPIMIGQTGQMLAHTADIIMVGKVGSVALAGAAFSASVYIVPYLFGLGIATAITPLLGRAVGQHNQERQEDIVRSGLWLLTASFALITVLSLAISPLLGYFGQPEEVVEVSKPYYFWLALSIFPSAYFLHFKQVYEGLSQTKPPTVVMLLCNVLNIFLNYLLIYGKWGFPELGLEGAGIATFISRCCMGLLGWLVLKSFSPSRSLFAALQKRTPSRAEIAEMFKLGVPISMQMVLEAGAFAGGAIISGTLGATAMSAHQIVINVASITFLIANSVGSASTIVISTYRGEGKFALLPRVGYVALVLAVVFMSLTAVFFLLFNEHIPLLYIDDVAVIALAAQLFIIAGVFQVFDGVQTTMLGALRGMEDVRIPTLITLVAFWAFALPLSYFLALHTSLGVLGVWVGYVVGLFFISMLLVLRFRLVTKVAVATAGK